MALEVGARRFAALWAVTLPAPLSRANGQRPSRGGLTPRLWGEAPRFESRGGAAYRSCASGGDLFLREGRMSPG